MKIKINKLFAGRSKDKLSFTPNPFKDWKWGLVLIAFLILISGFLHYFIYLYFITPPLNTNIEPLVKVLNKDGVRESARIIENKKELFGEEEIVGGIIETEIPSIDPGEEL